MQEETGISVAKFDALAQLDRFPDGISMTRLSQALKVTNGNVSGLVNRMIKDGLVEKHMSQTDRRSFSASLTAAGQIAFNNALRVHEAVLADLLQTVPQEELAKATTSLKYISSQLNLGEDDDGHTP